jgi:hypothetical protein
MSHGQTRTHKTHHDPDLGETITFPPYSIFCVWPRGQNPNVILSQDSQVGSPEIPEIGPPKTLEAHNFLWKKTIEMRFETKL